MFTKNTQEKEENKTMDFLGYFNEIDKFFDKILDTKKFLTYNEKIKEISKGNYKITKFIQVHETKLKYFGEVRNQISHGIKLDGHTYIYPTEHAIKQLKKLKNLIIKTPLAKNFLHKKIVFGENKDSIKTILKKIENIGFLAIKDKNKVIGILSEDNIIQRISKNIDNSKNLKKTKITEIPLMDRKEYKFITANKNLHEINEIFFSNQEIKILILKDNGKLSGLISKKELSDIENYIFSE